MATTPTTNAVLAYIRHWIGRARAETSSDADLLRRFAEDGEESAFALLMDRHGTMVLGTARRLLGDDHLAEDVFQATFLTLARQSGRLRRAAALPAWLHAVACRLALTALRSRKRRRSAEREAFPRAPVCPLEAAASGEQLAILDEELRRLPERFRLPLVLCCLEGRSQAEAAVLLGWTPGSVKGRLERGRRRLRDRLVRRGLTLAITAALPTLVRPTLAASLREAALRAARPGANVSPLVSELVHEACKPLFVGCKRILVIAILGLMGSGVGVASRMGWPEQSALSTSSPPPSADEDKPASPHVQHDPNALPRGAVARLGWSPLRIGNAAFALTPDGRTIVTVTPQGLVRRFDAKTGQLLECRQLPRNGNVDPVGQAFARLSADGQVAVLNEPDEGNRRLTVWDVTLGKPIFQRTSTAKRHTGLGALSTDGKLLALIESEQSSGYKKALRIVRLDSGEIRDISRLELNVYDVFFSADGKRLAASQIGGAKADINTLVCVDVTAGREMWRVPNKGINFAFSPDGKTVLSVVRDQRTIQILQTDADSGKPVETIVSYANVHPNDPILIAPDNRTVVLNHFGEIVLWDLPTRQEIRRFHLPTRNVSGYGPSIGGISPDSRSLLTNVGHLQRWDLTTGKPFFEAPADDALSGPIQYLAFTPDGKEMFAASWGLTSGRWDIKTKKRIDFVNLRRGRQLIRTLSGLRELGVDSYKSPYQVELIDPIVGKTLSTVRWAEPNEVTVNGLRAFTLTSDGKTLLAVHGREAGEKPQMSYVTACSVTSGRRLARFAVPGDFWFERSPFSPCGRWVAIGQKVYHVGSGAELFAPAGEPGERLVAWNQMTRGSVWFSEDGRLMAGLLRKKKAKSAANDALAVWELATGALLARYPNAGLIAQAAFAPDGRNLALLNGHGIRLEDLRAGKRLAEYDAPDVNCDYIDRGCTTQTLIFAPDGSTLATGHLDGTIVLWKVPQARESKPVALTEGEIDKLWTDLGSSSPATARAAVDRLARHPETTTALLAMRFRPPRADDKLAALIQNLDSDDFATREQAARKLRDYGARAEAVLRRTLTQSPSLEMRRRLEDILSDMKPRPLRLPLSGERLRGVRAIEVLERIGNTATRELLQSWAEQTEDGQLAVEARLALERLGPATAK